VRLVVEEQQVPEREYQAVIKLSPDLAEVSSNLGLVYYLQRKDAEAIKASGLPVYVHSPYLVNLAAANPKIRIPSRKILQQCCDAAVEARVVTVAADGTRRRR